MSLRDRGDAGHRLIDADAHLRALIDHSSSAIYLKDAEHRFLMVNRRHMDLWPEKRDFRPGMTAYDIFPAEVADWFCESDDTVWRSGAEFTFEEKVPLADGVHTYVSSEFPVRDAQGRIIAVGGISTDVTELRRAHESIAHKEDVLRRLIDVQEAEKHQLCNEFHEGLIQYVVGSKMILESLDRGRLPADYVARLESVIEHLARGLEDGRRVIRGIRPAALDDLGLAAALEELCRHERPVGPAIDLDVDHAVDLAPAGLQTTAYRVVQEAISNAIRHSGADRVVVSVRRRDTLLDLVVSDDGHGFRPRADGHPGFGLIGMEERVRLAGGDFAVETAPGAGTRITVRLPLEGVVDASDADALCGKRLGGLLSGLKESELIRHLDHPIADSGVGRRTDS